MPALAARAPLGATKAATGTGEARIALMISRIDVSSPPGVSICSTTSCAPSRSARVSPRVTKSAVAGPMAPTKGRTSTGAALALAAAMASNTQATIRFTIFTRTASRNQVWVTIIAENALARGPEYGSGRLPSARSLGGSGVCGVIGRARGGPR